MAAAANDSIQLRVRRPRITLSDAIVLGGALVAFLVGWGIKGWHDGRVETVEVEGVTVAYPHQWLRLPGQEPVRLNAISNEDGRTRIILASAETPQTDVLLAIATNNANPASGSPGYTQLGNRTAEVDGNAAVVTDYAYVSAVVGGSTPPAVIRGRQYAWIKDGTLYVYALEAPESRWSDERGRLGKLVDEIKTS